MVRRIIYVIVGVGALVTGFLVVRGLRSPQEVTTCFVDARGLRAGASVRIAGVDVGTVRSVRVDSQRKECPARVDMSLTTVYKIKIPNDSLTEIQRDGLLGPALVNIDISHASGAPIENYGYLESKQN